MPQNGPIFTDDSGEPQRQPRGVPGGFTGGGGGGGGGVGHGGVGGQGFDSRQLGFGQTGYGQKKKYYTPGRDDQMGFLQTGEKVMNNGVTQDPQTSALLDALNEQGRQNMDAPHFAGGGTMRGYDDGGDVPPPEEGAEDPGMGLSPSVRILKMLLDLDEHCGGGDHYAMGGTVGGGFANRMLGRGAATPPSPTGGYNYNPEGGVTGGFNPSDPYGAYTQNHDTSALGAATRIAGQYGAAGSFDPHGDPIMLNKLNELGQQDANDYAGRVYNQADASGLDPAAAASLKLRALASAGQGSADALNRYRVGYAQDQDAFGKGMLGKITDANVGFTGQTNNARLEDWAAGNQANRAHKNQWGDLAGGVIGSAAGGYFGGGRGGGGGGSGLTGRNPTDDEIYR